MAENEPKAWTLMHTILAAMGALIVILLGFGFTSITSQIKDGDAAINCELREIKQQHKETSHQFLEMAKDVATLKANQNARLDREKIESERKFRIEKP
jgi:hypothetical protein